jgi:hypothetical protein
VEEYGIQDQITDNNVSGGMELSQQESVDGQSKPETKLDL